MECGKRKNKKGLKEKFKNRFGGGEEGGGGGGGGVNW